MGPGIIDTFVARCCNRQCVACCDGKDTRLISHSVVALICVAAGRDGIGVYILTLGSFHGVPDCVTVQCAAHSGSQLGIVCTIDLALVVCGHSHCLGCYLQLVAVGGSLVVGILRLHLNRSLTHIGNGRCCGAPGLSAIHAVADGGACGHIGCGCCAMGCSVIDILIVHAAHGQCSSLRNRQLTRVYRSNFVEITGINLTHSAVGEIDGVLARICLGSGCGDTLEGHTIGRSGIAADGLLRTIVGVCARVGLKGHILIIVNDDLIVAGADLAGLGLHRDGGIAINGDRSCTNRGTKCLTAKSLVLFGINVLAIPLVAHRVAQITSDRPAASEGHILCRHSELAVCHSGIIGSPPGEGIASHRGLVSNLYGGTDSLL